MSLYRYLKPSSVLPEEQNSWSVFISYCKQVTQVQEQKRKRGSYSKSISSKEKANMLVKFATVTLKESTVRDWNLFYLDGKKGTKSVELAAIDDKHQITRVFGSTLSGVFLPIQMTHIKTKKCLPINMIFGCKRSAHEQIGCYYPTE